MKHLKLVALANVVALLLILFTPVLPARALDGTSPCPGSLATRLKVGDRGQVAQRFSSLRSSPGGPVSRVMGAGATFTGLEGPQCGNTLTHYRIDYGNGVTGWASESQIYSEYGYNQYWLAPVTTTPTTPTTPTPPTTPVTSCPGSLPPRLTVGGRGTVAQSYSTLRSSPAGAPIRIVGNGAAFTVLEGPVCAGTGSLMFWRIDYGGGLTGWANESERSSLWGSNQYWLAPLGAS
jgi:hypothetical protein